MNVIIFGAGKIGEEVYFKILARYVGRKDEIFYFDSDKRKQGTYVNDALILSYTEFVEKVQGDTEIVLAADCWRELLEFCQKERIDDKIIAIYNNFSLSVDPYVQKIYGQEAEDMYIKSCFDVRYGKAYKGFYVDVGAHHPFRFSNTQWAYMRGWSGINIEPNTEAIKLFNHARKRDINVNCGIGREEKTMKYYRFEEPAFNTFVASELTKSSRLEEVVDIPVRQLRTVLNEHKVEKVDFLNIDVEGFEMDVIQSNDWERYKPLYILVEQKNMAISTLVESEIYFFLRDLGYECEWKGRWTAIYCRSDI